MLRLLFRAWRIRTRAAVGARAVVVHWRLWQLRQVVAQATKFARRISAARLERKTFQLWRWIARRAGGRRWWRQRAIARGYALRVRRWCVAAFRRWSCVALAGLWRPQRWVLLDVQAAQGAARRARRRR